MTRRGTEGRGGRSNDSSSASLFSLLYHQFAWSYDAVSWLVSLGQWRAWTAAGLPWLTGPRVLELGHGPGHLLAMLAARGFEPVGLDLSPQMGRLASQRRVANGRPALVRGRAQALPFAAGAFDGALATFPTPYIIAPATVAAVHRALRPGGRLVVVPEARLGGAGPLVRVIDWLYAVTGQHSGADDDTAARAERWARYLAGPGFAVSVHNVAVGQSVVTIVVGEKEIVDCADDQDKQSA